MSGTVSTGECKFIRNSEVGRVVFDGRGAFTGVAAVTSGGKVEVGEVKGTLEIGSDCTDTGKMVYPNVTLDFNVVVANAGGDFALVVRSAEATLSGTGTKVESVSACTAASMNGSYAYQGEGVIGVDAKAQSIAEIGILKFDRKGEVTGVYSNISGGTATIAEFKGVYEMTDVCFGSAAYKVGEEKYQMNYMLTNRGNSMLYSELGPRYVVTGAAARTFPK